MRPVFKIFLSIFAVILLLPFLLDYRQFAFFSALTLGWFGFLQRTLPKLTWNSDLIGMTLLSVVLILFLAHKFLNGISRSIAAKRGTTWSWPWKWTWSSLIALMLFFLVGMAVGGTAHQIGWIASSPEPLLERNPFSYDAINAMKQFDLALRIALGDTNENLEKARLELWNHPKEYLGNWPSAVQLLQKYHVLVVVDEKGLVQGSIVFPRDAETLKRSGGVCSVDTENNQHPDSKEIAKLLQKYKARLVAL